MSDLPSLDFIKPHGHDGPHHPVRLSPPGSVQRNTPTEADLYPEHEKLKALDGQNQIIGQFIEWLNDNRYVICEWQNLGDEDGRGYYPMNRSNNSWIAQYFQIDPAKIEAEKRAMLAAIREMNEEADRER